MYIIKIFYSNWWLALRFCTISDKILYNKQIELYVKQMFQLKLFDI